MAVKTKQQWTRLFSVYGVTKDDYEEMDEGRCPLCLRRWGGNIVACVDHDHKSGYVRGLLCRYCNRYVLGRLGDPNIAQRITHYLTNQPLKIKVPPKKRKRKKRTKK